MSVDVVEQLRSLARSFDEFVGDVNTDEAIGNPLGGERRRHRWTLVAAAAIVLALVGALTAITRTRHVDAPLDGDGLSGAELADAIENRVWVALDYPLPQLPFLRFSDGNGAAGLVIDGYDGCNSKQGPFRLDGNTIAGSQIMSTLVGCTIPRIAGMWDGTTMTLDGETLAVTDPGGTTTRWRALDSMRALTPEELVGTYTMGTTPVTVTPESVVTEECIRAWAADGGAALRFTGSRCSAPVLAAYILMNAPQWTSAAGDDQRVVVAVDDRFVRLDRTTPDAPARPGLASFLGAIGDRTWVFDAPAAEYPAARRPSLRPPTEWTTDGDPLGTGYDGCNTYSLNGRWTPSGSGWQVAVADGGSRSVDCGDRPIVALENGSVLSLTPEGLLSVVAPNGTEFLFRDIRRATWTDGLQSPLSDLPGRWELDPGVVLEVKLGTGPQGKGVMTLGDCGVDWWMLGNEWIGAGPVPPDCVVPAGSPSAGSLLQLLDTGPGGDPAVPTVDRPITVGVNPERTVLYLADSEGTIVLRLTRVG